MTFEFVIVHNAGRGTSIRKVLVERPKQVLMRASKAIRSVLTLAPLCWALAASAADAGSYAVRIAPLIDPAKLATLGERGANPRVQKCVFWLAQARRDDQKPAAVLDRAVSQAGYRNKLAANLTKQALLRNLDIAGKLGCLDAEGLAAMRRGHAPTVRTGPYAGEKATVDHIIPRAVVPELDNVIANLELMPAKLNESKNDKIGVRQLDLARKFHAAKLLTEAGLKAVERRASKPTTIP